MDRSGCQKALILLDQGWQDGLGEIDFRYVAGHLADCPECASKARSSSRVDSALHELGEALDRATPRSNIAGRVSQALARESAASASADAGRPEEFELAHFLERLRRDAALCQQVARAANRGARLASLGQEHGFRFSEATVDRTLSRYQAANDGELSDEQLEAVAGGAAADFALLQELLGGLPPSGNTA